MDTELQGKRRPRPGTDGALPGDAAGDRAFVVALARGMQVLECFRTEDGMLTAREIARRCKLSRPNLQRLTNTLTTLGYLRYDEHAGAFQLGTASIALGSAALTQHDVRRMAQPWMEGLAAFSGADVALAVRDRLNMVCIQICRSRAAIMLRLDVGARIPLARSAMGRAYLAAASLGERSELLERLRDGDEFGWPQTGAALDAASAEYRDTGCCIALGEWQQGINEIAAAFSPGGGLPEMVIGVCGSAQKLAPDYLCGEIRPRLLELMRRLPGGAR